MSIHIFSFSLHTRLLNYSFSKLIPTFRFDPITSSSHTRIGIHLFTFSFLLFPFLFHLCIHFFIRSAPNTVILIPIHHRSPQMSFIKFPSARRYIRTLRIRCKLIYYIFACLSVQALMIQRGLRTAATEAILRVRKKCPAEYDIVHRRNFGKIIGGAEILLL